MDTVEQASLLLQGACCSNCYYSKNAWNNSFSNIDEKIFIKKLVCAKYTLDSGQIVKLNTFRESECKIELNDFCEYFVDKIKI